MANLDGLGDRVDFDNGGVDHQVGIMGYHRSYCADDIGFLFAWTKPTGPLKKDSPRKETPFIRGLGFEKCPVRQATPSADPPDQSQDLGKQRCFGSLTERGGGCSFHSHHVCTAQQVILKLQNIASKCLVTLRRRPVLNGRDYVVLE